MRLNKRQANRDHRHGPHTHKSIPVVLRLYSQSRTRAGGAHCLVVGFTLWLVHERLQSSTGGRGGSWENVPTTLRSELMLYAHGTGLESRSLDGVAVQEARL